jgi:hypothetical protein
VSYRCGKGEGLIKRSPEASLPDKRVILTGHLGAESLFLVLSDTLSPHSGDRYTSSLWYGREGSYRAKLAVLKSSHWDREKTEENEKDEKGRILDWRTK